MGQIKMDVTCKAGNKSIILPLEEDPEWDRLSRLACEQCTPERFTVQEADDTKSVDSK